MQHLGGQRPDFHVEITPFSAVFIVMKTAIYVRVSTNNQATENQLPDVESRR